MKDQQKFERNNKDIALNILSVTSNTEKIDLIYKSKHNCSRKNQVVLLMITDNNQEDTPDEWRNNIIIKIIINILLIII